MTEEIFNKACELRDKLRKYQGEIDRLNNLCELVEKNDGAVDLEAHLKGGMRVTVSTKSANDFIWTLQDAVKEYKKKIETVKSQIEAL